jgi:cellulose synthase/poly-beta-1,6-N-acetylglucosamine synthase-like glycosyltransferase
VPCEVAGPQHGSWLGISSKAETESIRLKRTCEFSRYDPLMRPPEGPPATAETDAGVTVQTTAVFRPGDWIAFAFLTAINASALVAVAAYWDSLDHAWAPISLVMAVLILIGVAVWWMRWAGLPEMRRPSRLDAPDGLRVGVATTFVPGAESLEMLEETVSALVAMDYPHETWVLDEGDDEAVRSMCARLGVRHFTRRHSAAYNTDRGRFARATKYGNYNAWLTEVGLDAYDVVVAFDPDHVPVPAFLERVLGFFRDPGVGYVQAAQVYYNQHASFIARGAAEETYAYYSSLQMASFALGYPIVTGCHNAHRTSALRAIGGFPAHEADDLLMTIEYRAAGYRGIYVPEVLAAGITPVDWGGYLRQQRRWARSVTDVKLRYLPHFWHQLQRRERLVASVHGLHYLYAVTTVLGVAFLAFLLASGDRLPMLSLGGTSRLGVLVLAALLGDAYRQRFFIDRRREWGVHWRSSVLRFAKWPALLVGLWDVLRASEHEYLLTPKVRAENHGRWYLAPHVGVAAILAICWSIGLARGVDTPITVQVLAGVTAAVSLLIFSTGGRHFPAPYDSELQDERRQRTRSLDVARASGKA